MRKSCSRKFPTPAIPTINAILLFNQKMYEPFVVCFPASVSQTASATSLTASDDPYKIKIMNVLTFYFKLSDEITASIN